MHPKAELVCCVRFSFGYQTTRRCGFKVPARGKDACASLKSYVLDMIF
jgi:hypothetical protein